MFFLFFIFFSVYRLLLSCTILMTRTKRLSDISRLYINVFTWISKFEDPFFLRYDKYMLPVSCTDDLHIDYQFTFNLSKPEDRHIRQINFMNVPAKSDVDTSFKIQCSKATNIKISYKRSKWLSCLCSFSLTALIQVIWVTHHEKIWLDGWMTWICCHGKIWLRAQVTQTYCCEHFSWKPGWWKRLAMSVQTFWEVIRLMRHLERGFYINHLFTGVHRWVHLELGLAGDVF